MYGIGKNGRQGMQGAFHGYPAKGGEQGGQQGTAQGQQQFQGKGHLMGQLRQHRQLQKFQPGQAAEHEGAERGNEQCQEKTPSGKVKGQFVVVSRKGGNYKQIGRHGADKSQIFIHLPQVGQFDRQHHGKKQGV